MPTIYFSFPTAQLRRHSAAVLKRHCKRQPCWRSTHVHKGEYHAIEQSHCRSKPSSASAGDGVTAIPLTRALPAVEASLASAQDYVSLATYWHTLLKRRW